MPRLTEIEKQKKIKEARRLYIKGFDAVFIAQAVGIGRDTVAAWAAEQQWEQIRQSRNISIEEVNIIIFQSIDQIKKGETPSVSPDQVAKLVAAYEKLNDKEKSLRYGIHAYETLTDRRLEQIKLIKSKQKQQQAFEYFNQIRSLMDDICDNWHTAINN